MEVVKRICFWDDNKLVIIALFATRKQKIKKATTHLCCHILHFKHKQKMKETKEKKKKQKEKEIIKKKKIAMKGGSFPLFSHFCIWDEVLLKIGSSPKL